MNTWWSMDYTEILPLNLAALSRKCTCRFFLCTIVSVFSYSTSADTNNIADKRPKSSLLNKINFMAVSRRCKCIFSLSKEFAKQQTEQYFSLKKFMKSFKAFQKTEDDRGCSFITDFSMSVMYFTLDYREIILWCQVQICMVIYVSLFILFFSIFTQRHRDRQEEVKETGPGAHYSMDSWPGLSWSSHWIRFKFKVDDIIFISRPFFFFLARNQRLIIKFAIHLAHKTSYTLRVYSRFFKKHNPE